MQLKNFVEGMQEYSTYEEQFTEKESGTVEVWGE
jgi:hypothetical protein